MKRILQWMDPARQYSILQGNTVYIQYRMLGTIVNIMYKKQFIYFKVIQGTCSIEHVVQNTTHDALQFIQCSYSTEHVVQ